MKLSQLITEANNPFDQFTTDTKSEDNESRYDVFTSLIRNLINTIDTRILDRLGPNGSNVSSENYDYIRRMYKKELTEWFAANYADIKSAASSLATITNASAFKRIRDIPVSAYKSSAIRGSSLTKSAGFWKLQDDIPSALRMIGQAKLADDYISRINTIGKIIANAYDRFGPSKNVVQADSKFEFGEIPNPDKLYYSKSTDQLYKVQKNEYVLATPEDYIKFQEDGLYDDFIQKIKEPLYFDKLSASRRAINQQRNTIDAVSSNSSKELISGLRTEINTIFNNIYSSTIKDTMPELSAPSYKLEVISGLTKLSTDTQEHLLSVIKSKTTPVSKLHAIKEFIDKGSNVQINKQQNFNTVMAKITKQYEEDQYKYQIKKAADKKHNLLLALMKLVPSILSADSISKFIDRISTIHISNQSRIFYDLDPTIPPTVAMRDIEETIDTLNRKGNPDVNNPLTLISKFPRQQRLVLDQFLLKTSKEQLPTASRIAFLTKLLSLSEQQQAKIVDIISKSPEVVIQLINSGKI